MRRRDLIWLAGLAAPGLGLSLPALAADTRAADRRAEVRLAGPAQGARPAREAAGAAGLDGRLDRVPGRPAAARGAERRRHRLRHHRRGAADLRPGRRARRCSMSATSRRRRAARRSWCPRIRRSPSVADLKGRKVALNKGSNVHYLLVRALEAAGVGYGDIEPVYLPPADARAAFERGAVDAWAIWDPFLAAAQAATGARTLADGTGLVSNHQFYLAAQPFAADQPGAGPGDPRRARRGRPLGVPATPARSRPLLAPRHGHPGTRCSRWRSGAGLRRAAARRRRWSAEQQKIADTFHGLGLLPKPINVSRQPVWKASA